MGCTIAAVYATNTAEYVKSARRLETLARQPDYDCLAERCGLRINGHALIST